MAILLALYCLIAPNVPLVFMATGFAFSALGDYFLDLPNDKFIPGLLAFFAAHIAFLIYLWPHAGFIIAPNGLLLCTGLALVNIAFFLWLRPSLDKDLKLPVAAYSAVIAIMGMAAFTTDLLSIFIPIGAGLFIASDVVLALERFKYPNAAAKQLNWILYAVGQILLAVGVVGATI